MPRYLVKRRGRTIDYVPIPKGVPIQRTSGGYKVKGGVTHKGYRLVKSKSVAGALRKVV